MSYEVVISEEQRQIIERALTASAETAANEEASTLLEMVKGLPAVEAEHPGILHGLCL